MESQLIDLLARLPAHSISPQLIAEMDEIDEQIKDVRSRLAAIEADQTGEIPQKDQGDQL